MPEGCILAKFLLMRWDQLKGWPRESFGARRYRSRTCAWIRRALERALADISDPHLSDCRPFREYAQAIQYEQHDFSKECVWEVRGNIPNSETAQFRKAAGGVWYVFRGLSANSISCRVLAEWLRPGCSSGLASLEKSNSQGIRDPGGKVGKCRPADFPGAEFQ